MKVIISKEDDFEKSVAEFRKVHQETRNHNEGELWKELTSFMISLNNAFHDRLVKYKGTKSYDDFFLKISSSLIYARVLDSVKTMQLIGFEIHSGAYRSAIRNLRFLLESMIHAYYMDKKHPNMDVLDKMSMDEVDKLTRYDLIVVKCGFSETVYQFFRDLSQYAHNTKEERDILANQLIDKGTIPMIFRFEESLFKKCVNLTIDVMDVFVYVVLEIFPEITGYCKDLILSRTFVKDALGKSALKLTHGRV
jgi:hypothetical protein